MRKVTMCLAGGAVAAVAALAAAQPARALPIADGSFSMKAVSGSFSVNTGDITAKTSSVTEASLGVLAVNGSIGSVVHSNDSVVLSNQTLPVPPAGSSAPVTPTLTLTVDGLVFSFNTATTKYLDPVSPTDIGGLTEQFDGLLSNGNNVFQNGTAARLSLSCDQAAPHSEISCSSTDAIVGLVSPPGGVGVPEPASLTIVGASLLGFGLLRRRRTP